MSGNPGRWSACVLVALTSFTSPAWAEFSFASIDGLRDDVVVISGDGQTVVGNATSINGVAQPALWTPARGVVRLGALPGGDTSGYGLGISFDGSVIVGGASSSRGLEAFRWTASQGIVGLGDLPGDGVFANLALGVSAGGQVVVGQSQRSWPLTRAFRWTAETGLTDLGDLPGGDDFSLATAVSSDGNVIAGASRSAAGEEAMIWTPATGMIGLGDLPGGGVSSRARAVSADGNVVVGMGVSAKGFEAFRWTRAGGMIGMGSLDPNDFASMANAVSGDGNVVVGTGSGAADFNGEAFVWFPATGMLNLRQYLQANGVTSVQGWRLVAAHSVSIDGRVIVGTGLNPQGRSLPWIARIEVDTRPAPPDPAPGPPDAPETIAPIALSVLAGVPVSGGVAQLQASDDSYLRVQETGQRTMQVTVTGHASRPGAAELRFAIEAAAQGSTTRQQVALFDFSARQWVTLSDRTATSTDSTVEVRADRAARFIEPGSLRVVARITFTPSGPRRVVTSARIDRASWHRTP
jgi:probable HAF family extracellular repeat protein